MQNKFEETINQEFRKEISSDSQTELSFSFISLLSLSWWTC